jgi:hypothetical protein
MLLYFKHFDTEEVIILQTRKQKYYFDSTIGKYRVLRESKMCQYVIGSAHTPLIVCTDDQLSIPCLCMSEIKYTHVYLQFQRSNFYPVK